VADLNYDTAVGTVKDALGQVLTASANAAASASVTANSNTFQIGHSGEHDELNSVGTSKSDVSGVSSPESIIFLPSDNYVSNTNINYGYGVNTGSGNSGTCTDSTATNFGQTGACTYTYCYNPTAYNLDKLDHALSLQIGVRIFPAHKPLFPTDTALIHLEIVLV